VWPIAGDDVWQWYLIWFLRRVLRDGPNSTVAGTGTLLNVQYTKNATVDLATNLMTGTAADFTLNSIVFNGYASWSFTIEIPKTDSRSLAEVNRTGTRQRSKEAPYDLS
jgi:hypothetical protein